MGDSAGGNLCLGLSRYLGELAERSQREEIKKIGQVGGMILHSVSYLSFRSFGELTAPLAVVRHDVLRCIMHHERQICPYQSAFRSNETYLFPQDYPTAFGASGVQSHSRHFPSHLASPYFSPSLPAADGSQRFGHLKRGGVKVYIQTGTAEILYDEDVQLARGMRDEGVDVRLREVSPHLIDVSVTLEPMLIPLNSWKERCTLRFCSSARRRCSPTTRTSPSFGSRCRSCRSIFERRGYVM